MAKRKAKKPAKSRYRMVATRMLEFRKNASSSRISRLVHACLNDMCFCAASLFPRGYKIESQMVTHIDATQQLLLCLTLTITSKHPPESDPVEFDGELSIEGPGIQEEDCAASDHPPRR